MKILAFAVLLTLLTAPIMAQEDKMSSLKNTYNQWVRAWNEKDAKTVAEISWGNYGFGRDVPFLRTGAKDQSAYEKGIAAYMQSMEVLNYQVHYSSFSIIDGVGLIDGYYAQTTKQYNGTLRTVYGRQSLVLTQKDNHWKMIHYHRSPLPNEFVR